jgi:hypothetical protein
MSFLIILPHSQYTSSFRKFLQLVYYTETSNLASIYTTFPSKYFPWAVIILPTFVKLFTTSVSVLIAFAAAFSVFSSRPFFSEHFSVVETGKGQTMTNLHDMADAPKPLQCAWQDSFRPVTTEVQG